VRQAIGFRDTAHVGEGGARGGFFERAMAASDESGEQRLFVSKMMIGGRWADAQCARDASQGEASDAVFFELAFSLVQQRSPEVTVVVRARAI
jgi:hypothetical protein